MKKDEPRKAGGGAISFRRYFGRKASVVQPVLLSSIVSNAFQ